MKTTARPTTTTQADPASRQAQAQPDQRPATVAQRQTLAAIADSPRQTAQREKNRTGLPDHLKAGVENLSGHSLDDVRVHYNSAQPAQLQAHAYAQGTDIHLAPGQEKHLPHEAWHVAQQKQGRVKPTMQLKGVGVNDNDGLEKEADQMGARAAGFAAARSDEQPAGVGARATPATSVAQLVERRVLKGGATTSSWKFLRSEGPYDVYEDHQPATSSLSQLASTRDASDMMLGDDNLSELEDSETEIDTKGEKSTMTGKIKRITNIRKMRKLQQKYQLDRSLYDKNIAVRMGREGEGGVFRLVGKGTQVHIKGVSKKKLTRRGKPVGGYAPKPTAKDTKATGPLGSYEHLTSPFAATGQQLGDGLHGKFVNPVSQPYPSSMSAYDKYKADEAMAVMGLAEPLRTPYGLPLAVGAIGALRNGSSTKDVFYKGSGATEALHPGTSSHSIGKVSGQLMEQNLGVGRNVPHATQPSMSLTSKEFGDGAARAKKLFDKASAPGETHFQMLSRDLQSVLPSSTASATYALTPDKVATERSTPYGTARFSLKLNSGQASPTDGQQVSYKGSTYTARLTAGWLHLD